MYNFISICVSIFNFEVLKMRFQMGIDSPPHLSPNLHFNLQIKMSKRKSRSKMGLLNTLQFVPLGHNIPEVLVNIPGLDVDHLTEADLLLANPETHTHPYGSHPLLPIHENYDVPHSHPPFSDAPVIDLHHPGTS